MTDLSPAAAAVRDAFDDSIGIDLSGDGYVLPLAAAIHAAGRNMGRRWSGAKCVEYLYAIASELENMR